jgi:fructokinase
MRVLAFGEILWDLIDGTPYLGGAPFNFAAHFARCGNESYLVSRVGNDNLGWRALNDARDHRVDCTYVGMHRTAPTGTVDVFLKDGEPDYTITENVAFDEIQVDERLLADKFDTLYYGTLAQRSRTSAESLQSILDEMIFTHVFFDVNLRKGGWNSKTLKESLSRCTILKLNSQEVARVGESIGSFTSSLESFCRVASRQFECIRTIVITDGSNGCYVFHDDTLQHSPGFQVDTVDTIGAGDAFSAVFMHLFATTGDVLRAGAAANRVGAFVASRRAAIPEYNSEIRQLIV